LEIAKKHNKLPAQILLRFQIQLGNVVIPKSVTKDRIASNIDVFNFTLSDDDMNALQNFGHHERICALSQDVNHPQYPFHED
jgi:aldehyde reductase